MYLNTQLRNGDGEPEYYVKFLTFGCSLDYLKQIAGPRTVPVEVGSRYTDEDWTQKLMLLSDFIEEFILQEVMIILFVSKCVFV